MKSLLILSTFIFLFACQNKESKSVEDRSKRLFSAQVALNLVDAYYQEYGHFPNTFGEIISNTQLNLRVPSGFNGNWELVKIKGDRPIQSEIIATEIVSPENNHDRLYIYYVGEGEFQISSKN